MQTSLISTQFYLVMDVYLAQNTTSYFYLPKSSYEVCLVLLQPSQSLDLGLNGP